MLSVLPDTHSRNLGVTNFIPPFILGFSATAFQVFLLREFTTHFAGNEMTYGLVLGSWLLWGGLGSLFASRFRDHTNGLIRCYYSAAWLFLAGLAGLRLSRFALGLLPGESSGLGPAGLAALVLSFMISFPLGILFVFNTRFRRGDVASVYVLESIGAATGGLTVQFLLIPFFSNWKGASLATAFAVVLIFFGFEKRSQRLLFPLTLAGLTIFGLLDGPSQRLFWKPYTLLATEDSPYGKLQVLKAREQISLYINGAPVFSYPHSSAAEESVHFALLQRRPPFRVLLIGGGVGSLSEALKYPGMSVDCVEIDPDLFRFSSGFLPPELRRVQSDSRVRLFHEDGRAFLSRSREEYDAILLNLPEPATAQINRFYTQEFFLLAENHLSRDGIFSFRVASAENYISPELGRYLATLFHTLKSVFPVVRVVPGDTNIFLASAAPLSIDSEFLAKAIHDLGLLTTDVSPRVLPARLNPLRIARLREKLEAGAKRLNRDLRPLSIYEHALLWSTQFHSFERPFLEFLSRLPSFWILDFPLGLSTLGLVFLRIKRNRPSLVLVPISVMGLTTMAVEIMMLIWFQTLFGSVYGRLAALLAMFMAGLSAGSLFSSRSRRVGVSALALIFGGFLTLLLLSRAMLNLRPPSFFFFVALFLFGFLGGSLFIVSNRLYLNSGHNYGLGYGLDLLGSFMGAAAASAFLIPLFGMAVLLKYLVLLNSFCLLFLISGLDIARAE
jgi:spermidine synthase